MSIRLKTIIRVHSSKTFPCWWENGGTCSKRNDEETDWKKEKPKQNPIPRAIIEDSGSKKIEVKW